MEFQVLSKTSQSISGTVPYSKQSHQTVLSRHCQLYYILPSKLLTRSPRRVAEMRENNTGGVELSQLWRTGERPFLNLVVHGHDGPPSMTRSTEDVVQIVV